MPPRRKFRLRHQDDGTATRFAGAGLILTLAAVLIYLAVANWKIWGQRLDLNNALKQAREEAQGLEKKNEEFQKGIAEAETEGYFERAARERLNLKKPGEEVVVIIPPEDKSSETSKSPENLWRKILEKISFLRMLASP